jgi:ATP-dependent DNA helicase RecG
MNLIGLGKVFCIIVCLAMTATLDDLDRWMNSATETENLEFKLGEKGYDTTKLCRYCVALGNEGGGKLILGVTNDRPRKVVGTQAINDPAGMQTKILDKLHMYAKIEELNHPDGRVVIVHAPSRPAGDAFNLDGAYWMRSGESLVPMTSERLRDIFAEGKPDWLMRIARDHCSASDVIQLLDTQSYFDLLNLPYPMSRGGVLERFESEKFIVDEGDYSVTNLGAVLFAKRLDAFDGLSRKAPRVMVYDGTDKLGDSRVFKPGTKGYAVGFQGLVDFVNSHIPSNEVIRNALRVEMKMFPEIAIRELVANALIHQDFNETGTSVAVELYSDRIEISNPGRSVISTERFIDEYQSRNEGLADVMRRLGMCEEQGKGVDRVVAFAEAWQLPAPDWRAGERHTTAIMFAHKKFSEMDGKDRVRACFQHCVLRWMTNQKMTNTSLRERFNLPESKSETVSRIIADAIQQEKIKPVDPTSTSKRYANYVPRWA